MSIKSKVLAAAATLTLVGGVGVAGALSAGTASAATPSCGNSCIDIFSHQFGTHKSPNYVVDVLRQGEKTGQPIILFRTANFDPAEDWTVAFQGTTADFFAAGLVSSAVALHYGCIPTVRAGTSRTATGRPRSPVNDPAFEIEYAPFGVDSGLCMGVAATAFNDEGVTLQPCGVSSKTVWIADIFDSLSTLFNGYIPADQRLGHQLLPAVRPDLPERLGARPTSRVRSSSSPTSAASPSQPPFPCPGRSWAPLTSTSSGAPTSGSSSREPELTP